MKLPIILRSRHRAVVSDLQHHRRYWAWKYERREAECEELAKQIRDLWAALREEIESLRRCCPSCELRFDRLQKILDKSEACE